MYILSYPRVYNASPYSIHPFVGGNHRPLYVDIVEEEHHPYHPTHRGNPHTVCADIMVLPWGVENIINRLCSC